MTFSCVGDLIVPGYDKLQFFKLFFFNYKQKFPKLYVLNFLKTNKINMYYYIVYVLYIGI